jgi:acyl carrier protein
MNDNELKDLVLKTLGDIAPEAELDDIDPHENFRDQVDIDSVDFLNFVIALHTATGLEIPEVDYPKLSSLDGAVKYLQAHGA